MTPAAVVVRAMLMLTALATPAYAAERFEATLRPTDFTFSPGAGRASERSVILWSTGAASATWSSGAASPTVSTRS